MAVGGGRIYIFEVDGTWLEARVIIISGPCLVQARFLFRLGGSGLIKNSWLAFGSLRFVAIVIGISIDGLLYSARGIAIIRRQLR